MSSHRFPKDWLSAPWDVTDPGASGTVDLSNKGRAYLAIVTAAAESRTIPAPDRFGQELIVSLKTDGGNATVAITGGVSGLSSVVLDDAGDAFCLVSIDQGGTYKWAPAWSSGPLSGFPQVLGGNVTVEGTLESVGAATFDSTQTLTGNTTSTGQITTTRGVASGTALNVGGVAYAMTSNSKTVANTTAETNFDTYVIPANTLRAGTVVYTRYQGIATVQNNSNGFLHKLKIGSTALITSTNADAAANKTFYGEFCLVCRSAGASGTVIGSGFFKDVSAEATFTAKDVKLAETTLDTTANQTLAVTCTHNTATNSAARLDVFTVEIA